MSDGPGSTRKAKPSPKRPSTQFSSRKKACSNCADAKARCDLHRPSCTRCKTRGYDCQYFSADSPPPLYAPLPASTREAVDDQLQLATDTAARETRIGFAESAITLPGPPQPTSESVQIGSRWLDAIIAPSGKIAKNFSPQTIQFMSRLLKSHSRVMVKEDAFPSFVHPLQSAVGTAQRPLANCRSLLRMWESKAVGSEALVRETMTREMRKLFEEHRTYDHSTLLAACQAYLLYSIHLFFCHDAESAALVDVATTMNLQELASAMAALTGLQTAEESSPGPQQPSWEDWIAAEARRRTVYTLYSFDNVVSYARGTTSYIASELGHLPAPARKALWDARTRVEWQAEYEKFAAEWRGRPPLMEDLWPHEAREVTEARRQRVDRWVESVDEFGMAMFAVTSSTYKPL